MSPQVLEKVDAWWRAANYLSVGQIYLMANPLLREPLLARARQAAAARPLGHDARPEPALRAPEPGHRRPRPGDDLRHRARARRSRAGRQHLAGGHLQRGVPAASRRPAGMGALFRQFSFPGGIPSHVAPETPGSIHEGGELGYALLHAYGAALDNPDLRGGLRDRRRRGRDRAAGGELALQQVPRPGGDGAVLPILHLNGYKIANPTVLARIPTTSWTRCCAATATALPRRGRRPGDDARADGRDAGRGPRRDRRDPRGRRGAATSAGRPGR